MPTENEIQKRAEEVQKMVHKEAVEDIQWAKFNSSDLSYQAATNICIFRYLAKLELKIEELENK